MSRSLLVLVTRPAVAGDVLARLLAPRGVRVAVVPTAAVVPEPPGGALDAALADVAGWTWLVVTSATGARAVGAALGRLGLAHRPRIAAVGAATARALAREGHAADLVPATASGRAVAAALIADAPAGRLDGARILLARSDAAAADLPTALREAGAEVTDVVAYRTVEAPAASAPGIEIVLRDPALAAVAFASGSAVRGLVSLAGASGLVDVARATAAVSIGNSTSAVLRQQGFQAITEARSASVEALADAIVEVATAVARDRRPLRSPALGAPTATSAAPAPGAASAAAPAPVAQVPDLAARHTLTRRHP